jgi:hypothetical protein
MGLCDALLAMLKAEIVPGSGTGSHLLWYAFPGQSGNSRGLNVNPPRRDFLLVLLGSDMGLNVPPASGHQQEDPGNTQRPIHSRDYRTSSSSSILYQSTRISLTASEQHMILDIIRGVQAFVDLTAGPDPQLYFLDLSNPLYATKTVLFITLTVIGDAFVVSNLFALAMAVEGCLSGFSVIGVSLLGCVGAQMVCSHFPWSHALRNSG